MEFLPNGKASASSCLKSIADGRWMDEEEEMEEIIHLLTWSRQTLVHELPLHETHPPLKETQKQTISKQMMTSSECKFFFFTDDSHNLRFFFLMWGS
jgi:hypothetical protein